MTALEALKILADTLNQIRFSGKEHDKIRDMVALIRKDLLKANSTNVTISEEKKK